MGLIDSHAHLTFPELREQVDGVLARATEAGVDAVTFAAPCFDDCNDNGVDDLDDIANCAGDPACADCNGNDIPDGCELAADPLLDCDGGPVGVVSAGFILLVFLCSDFDNFIIETNI